jgi:hypothetical protein
MHHSVQRLRNFNRVEILALDVFNEGDFENAVLFELLDNAGDLVHAGDLGGSPAALPNDELETISVRLNDDGLDQTIDANRLSELFDSLVAKNLSGLVGARVDLSKWNSANPILA